MPQLKPLMPVQRWKTMEECLIGVQPNKRTSISHASTTNAFGLGTGSAYGHVKIANNLTTSTYADGIVLSAYQGYVISGKITTLTTNVSNLTTSVNGLSTDVTNLKGGQITLAVNPASTANMNVWITT